MHQVDRLALLDHIEPFNAPLSVVYSDRGPQLSQSSPSDATSPMYGSGPTHVTGISAHPRIGKAALMAQYHRDVQPPVLLEDSGVRFSENGEQTTAPSQLPNEIPPSYTSQ